MASETARKKYPAQIVVMTTEANKNRFREEADAAGVSIAEVIRGYLEAGIKAHDEATGKLLASGILPPSAPESRTDAEHEREQQYRGLL